MNRHLHRIVFNRARGALVAAAECVATPGRAAPGERGGPGRLGRAWALGALSLLWAPLQAQTLPGGGSIVSGGGSIGVNGRAMLVQQTSDRMVADWQSFSIGAGHSVRFVQPSAHAVALNRVVGSDASVILGSLTANGHVYLQNPNGVLFAPGAQVSVGSLVATTLNADPDAFLQGQLRLSGGSAARGEVRNAGDIRTAPGGHAVLAGPRVANSGRISTPAGTAALVAGNAVNVDPTGSGLLNISVPVAALDAAVLNSGSIHADGGSVQLQAAAADAALRTVMQVDGLVRARSIEQRDGQVFLSGGTSGVVRVGGTLDVSSTQGQGGTVKVLGERVALVGAAHLDASGSLGGGTVLVGGNYQGRGPEANATDTFVGPGVRIAANAGQQGDGGTVVVWADGSTRYHGRIEARGGATQGDGGQAEVSGKRHLSFAGPVDLTAAHGHFGTLLLDPDFLYIGVVSDLNGDLNFGDDLAGPTINAGDFPGASGPSQITTGAVITQLLTSDVSLAANVAISIDAPLAVAPGGAARTLTLQAPQIDINGATTLNNSALVANAGLASGSSINITRPVQSLNSIALTSTSITQTGTGGLTTPTLTLDASSGGSVDLAAAANVVGALNVTADTATLNIANAASSPLDLRGSVGSLSLSTSSGITQTAGALAVSGGFGLSSSAGDVALTQPGNVFGGNVSFTTAGNFQLQTSGLLNASGSAARNIRLTAGGLFTMTGDIVSTDAANPQLSAADRTVIRITGAGFNNSDNGVIAKPVGGQFVVRSTDYTQDNLGSLTFGPAVAGAASGQFSIVAFGNAGDFYYDNLPYNTFYTNQAGTMNVAPADVGPVSRTYDGSTGMSYTLSLSRPATASFGSASQTASRALADGPFTYFAAAGTGQFFDKQAGVDKGYATDPNSATALYGSSGASYFYLTIPTFIRSPGPSTTYPVSEVTRAALTSTRITAVNRPYDGSTAVALDTGAAVLSGVLGSDAVSVASGTGSVATKDVGTAKPVTVDNLVLAGADAANYSVTDASAATVDITKLELLTQGIAAIPRAYDGTPAVALDTSDVGWATAPIQGDSVALLTTAASGTMADKNAGTAKPVTITGLALGGADAANYSVADASNATVDIAARAVVSSGIKGANRTYDGTTVVALDTSAATLSGVLPNDAVTLAPGNGSVATKDVGTGKAVAIGSVALAGADAGNYIVTDTSAATVDIAPRALFSNGMTAVDRGYDGTTAVALNTSAAVLGNVIEGDAVTLVTANASGAMADKNAGTAKPVTITGLALAGADAANYSVADASNATVDIGARAVVSSGIKGVNRTYDGTTVVALDTSAATLSGVLPNDAVTLIPGNGSVATKDVGTGKAVAIGSVVLAGADAGNYTVTDTSAATVDITPRALFSNGITAVHRGYDGTTAVALDTDGATLFMGLSSVTPGVVDVIPPYAGDSVVLVTSAALGSMADKNAGSAKPVTITGLTLGGADAANYALSRELSNATVDIAPRAVVSSGISGVDRAYDGTTSVALNTSAAALTGVIAGDAVALAAGTGSVATKQVGNAKPVTIAGVTLAGPDAANYRLTDTSVATVDITPRAAGATGIFAVNRVYDGTTAVSLNAGAAALNNVVDGDAVTLVTASASGVMADKNAGTAKPVAVTGLALGGADAGNYSVVDASNATVDIATRAVATSGITAVNRVYDGSTQVALNTGSVALAGVIDGDVVGVVSANARGAMADKNAGTAKPVTVTGVSLNGADAANYSVADASQATVDIAARAVTSQGIAAVNRAYDGSTAVALNAGTASLDGVLAGDAVGLDITNASGTMADRHVGSAKPVTVAGVALSGPDAANYSLSDASRPSVDITQLALAAGGIRAIDRSYDGTVAVGLDSSAAGFVSAPVAGDAVTLVTTLAQGSMADKNAGTAKPVAITGLALSGADAGNYSVVDASGAKVNIAPLSLVPLGIVPLNRVEDGTNVVPLDTSGAAIPGILPGDSVALVTSAAVGFVASPAPGSDKPVLVTGLALDGDDARNYRLALGPTGGGGTGGATVTIFKSPETIFEEVRFNEYVQAISDAQEPFRRAMAEALAAGFGKENIRKQLQRGLVFETGLAPPAVDVIDSAARPLTCAGGREGAALVCP
jgi:filamentous hemagglutinin family protein